MKLNKTDYILIGIITLLAIGLFFVIRKGDAEELAVEQQNTKESYALVSEKSTFFTVESCANRYILNLSKKNVDNLMKIVDNQYLNSNNLNKSNLIKNLGELDDLYSFNARKMYYSKNGSITKYYIYGLLKKEFINEYDGGSDYYLIVNIDNKKNLFSVEPYDGKYFKEAL